MIGMSGVFGKVAFLPGFTADNFREFILPVGLLQGAGFTGAATGVNLARDIEQGWFDRLLVSPTPRVALLAGITLSASLRALLPATVLVTAGEIMGVRWPGLTGLLVAVLLFMTAAAVAASWSTVVALKFKSQQAAPLMQIVTFASLLCTTAYVPQDLLTGWLKPAARYNPVTQILESVRQGFIGEVTWSGTWPGLLTAALMLVFFGSIALRRLSRATV